MLDDIFCNTTQGDRGVDPLFEYGGAKVRNMVKKIQRAKSKYRTARKARRKIVIHFLICLSPYFHAKINAPFVVPDIFFITYSCITYYVIFQVARNYWGGKSLMLAPPNYL